MSDTVLNVQDLRVWFDTRRGTVRAVDGIDFSLSAGERLGLVGESGSGKSTTALALMRLIDPPGRIESGSAELDGEDLLAVPEERMRQIRLGKIAMIPQGAMNSLNPVARVKHQVIDGLLDHDDTRSRRELEDFVPALLGRVGLSPDVANLYPHELSGGMKQRVTIAIAISLNPRVIIADEPTSALDVVVQQQVMETLESLQEEIGAGLIIIGHDMGLMAQVTDRLGIMYAGKLVETGTVERIFSQPHHPYTKLLIESLPSLEGKGTFRGIPGIPPPAQDRPRGCAFHPRCPSAMSRCREDEPALLAVTGQGEVACFLHHEDAADGRDGTVEGAPHAASH